MISFTNLTKKPIRRAVFQKLYWRIFPKGDFELSVVFAPPALMKKLNIIYRGKNKAANVLSFDFGSPDVKSGPRLQIKNKLVRRGGEIFLNIKERDLPYLFVHGCLHLLGHDHKKNKEALRMERLEQKILKFTK